MITASDCKHATVISGVAMYNEYIHYKSRCHSNNYAACQMQWIKICFSMWIKVTNLGETPASPRNIIFYLITGSTAVFIGKLCPCLDK